FSGWVVFLAGVFLIGVVGFLLRKKKESCIP
ncbi:MAG: LPXTG cell wall anchor domain-containing protein, partial [Syntrophobacterales bacterium]